MDFIEEIYRILSFLERYDKFLSSANKTEEEKTRWALEYMISVNSLIAKAAENKANDIAVVNKETFEFIIALAESRHQITFEKVKSMVDYGPELVKVMYYLYVFDRKSYATLKYLLNPIIA